MEKCVFGFDYTEPGVYEVKFIIYYYNNGKKEELETEKMKIYCPPADFKEYEYWSLRNEFLLRRIGMYCGKELELPNVYKEILEYKNANGDYDFTHDHNLLECRIAAHYSAYNQETETLSLQNYVEIKESISFTNINERGEITLSNEDLDNTIEEFSYQIRDKNYNWKIDEDGNYIIPDWDLINLNPFARIETIDESIISDELIMSGYVYDDIKGYMHFKAMIKDIDGYKIMGIEYSQNRFKPS